MDGFDTFCVLKNDRGEYSLWPAERDVPLGWEQVGPTGGRDECLAWVSEVWTDVGLTVAPQGGSQDG